MQHESKQNNNHIEQQPDYWTSRIGHIYYHYVDFLVRAFAAQANSLIDVGSANASYVENFDWIPERYTLDIEKPYESENVVGFKEDFFKFKPEKKYDFVTCLQVLEHIPDAKSFATKLFQLADRVLISVPYMWVPGGTGHVHDPVDLDKLREWTGREPVYSIIVTEPLKQNRDKRIICYYHPEEEKLQLSKTREEALELLKLDSEMEWASNLESKAQFETNKELRAQLMQIRWELKLEQKQLIEQVGQVTEELKTERRKKKELESKLSKKKDEYKEVSSNYKRITQEYKRITQEYKKVNQRYNSVQRKYEAIQKTRTWRYTKPIRLMGNIIRSVFRKN